MKAPTEAGIVHTVITAISLYNLPKMTFYNHLHWETPKAPVVRAGAELSHPGLSAPNPKTEEYSATRYPLIATSEC